MAKRIGIIGAGKPSAIGLAAKILADQTAGVVHPASSGLLAKDGGVHEIVYLSGAEMYEAIKAIADTLPDMIVEDSNHLKYPALASSFHEFKSPALAEAYQDSDLTPVGAGYLDEIAGLKDQMVSFPAKIPIIQKYKTGHYYLRKLSRSERKAFIRGFKLSNAHIPLTDWLDTSFDDLEDMINTSFRWNDTPEGHDYWDGLATRSRWMISPPHMDLLDKINISKIY